MVSVVEDLFGLWSSVPRVEALGAELDLRGVRRMTVTRMQPGTFWPRVFVVTRPVRAEEPVEPESAGVGESLRETLGIEAGNKA